MSPKARPGARAAAALRTRQRAQKAYSERWEEVRHLLGGGSPPWVVASLFGVSCSALARQAYRHGDIEMGRLFEKASSR